MKYHRELVQDALGNAREGVSVTVYISGSTTRPILYATDDPSGPHLGNPLSTDGDGFASFFIEDGSYDITVGTGDDAKTSARVQLYDLDSFLANTTSAAADAANVAVGDAAAAAASIASTSVRQQLSGFTLAEAAEQSFDAAVTGITVSGAETVGDAGAGMPLVYDETVDAAYVTAHPATSFLDAGGRGFRQARRTADDLDFDQAGDGAPTRPLGDKARENVDLLDYYDADDGDDYLNAFTRAFAECVTKGGMVLHLPVGTLSVSDTLVYPNNIRIVGKGWRNTIVKLADGVDDTVMKSANWDDNVGGGASPDFSADLIGFTIDGNADNNTSGHGLCHYSHSHVMMHLRVINTAGRGIWTEYGNGGGTSWQGGMEAIHFDVTTDTTGEDGWYYNGPHDSLVQKVHCIDSWQSDDGDDDTPGSTTGAGFYGQNCAGVRCIDIHPWKRLDATKPRPKYSIYASAGVWTHCTAEGGHNPLLLDSSARFFGGDCFGTSPDCATVTLNGSNCVIGATNLTNNRSNNCNAIVFKSGKQSVDVSVSGYTSPVLVNSTGVDLAICDVSLRAYACSNLFDPSDTHFIDPSSNIFVRGDGSPALFEHYDSPGFSSFSSGGSDSASAQQLTRLAARIAASGTYRSKRLQAGQQQKIVNRTSGDVTIYPWSTSATFTDPGTGAAKSANSPITLGAYQQLILTGYATTQTFAHIIPLAPSVTYSTKVSAPASATASGSPGQWAADSDYIYAYTGDGTTHSWVRSTAATW